MKTLDAVILGIVEGVTEYLPVSSTGHLILTEHLMGIGENDSAKVYAIAIQLGAIAAVILLYRKYFLEKIFEAFSKEGTKKKESLRFFTNLFIAFLPVAVVGLLAGKWIKNVLFSSLWVLAALVVGGIVMIVVEHLLETSSSKRKTKSVEELSHLDAFGIGICQIFSLWPGFSRAMATILGGRIVGLDTKGAGEFSFFLAVPTLGAATLYEMTKALRSDSGAFDSQWWMALTIGMLVSFLSALIVIKGFLAFLRKYPLAIFAYYRFILATGLYFLLK